MVGKPPLAVVRLDLNDNAVYNISLNGVTVGNFRSVGIGNVVPGTVDLELLIRSRVGAGLGLLAVQLSVYNVSLNDISAIVIQVSRDNSPVILNDVLGDVLVLVLVGLVADDSLVGRNIGNFANLMLKYDSSIDLAVAISIDEGNLVGGQLAVGLVSVQSRTLVKVGQGTEPSESECRQQR